VTLAPEADPGSDLSAEIGVGVAAAPKTRVTRRLLVENLLGVLLPFAGLVTACVLLWGVAFNWLYLALLVGMYIATGLGITMGYHRLFAHKSYDAVPPLRWLLAVFGSMAAEGSVIDWVSWHREHHQHSDDEGDPHSPHAGHGDGFLGMVKGMWHAHMGWFIIMGDPDKGRYAKDLENDRIVKMVSRQFMMWMFIGLIIPGVIAGLVTMSWTGALLGFLWGGLVRMFFVHHVTWSINSICHIWGARPYESHDESRNNPIFGILGFGEGWHNNHHAFPASARHGLAWWQFDSSYMIIKALSYVGLTSNVRVPSPERLEAKRRK